MREASTSLELHFKAGEQTMDVWQQVKLHYIGLLVNHQQPELAETFFNSAVYYKYVNIDTDALMKTVGDADKVRHAVAVMVQAAALATPTGKQNSFAAHSVPELVLVEVSKRKQPISYANAFLEPVQGDDLMLESVRALGQYCESIAAAYAPPDTQRFLLAVGKSANEGLPIDSERSSTLADLASRVEKALASSPAGVK